jgi:hypothetical protein
LFVNTYYPGLFAVTPEMIALTLAQKTEESAAPGLEREQIPALIDGLDVRLALWIAQALLEDIDAEGTDSGRGGGDQGAGTPGEV